MNLAGYWRAVLSAAAALLLGCPGWAQGPGKAEEAKLTKEQQAFAKQVNDAIDKGVKYLRGGCDTCFTLLFLKRTNLTHDLTVNRRKNKGSMKLIEAIEAPGGTPP